MNRDQYHEYLQSKVWGVIRERVLRRDNHRCRVCNDDEGLNVHHRTYERVGSEKDEDLTTLCRVCHQLFEVALRLPAYVPTTSNVSIQDTPEFAELRKRIAESSEFGAVLLAQEYLTKKRAQLFGDGA